MPQTTNRTEGSRPEDKSTTQANENLTDKPAELPEDAEQTWIVDNNANGEQQRVKTEEYADWRAAEDKKIAEKR